MRAQVYSAKVPDDDHGKGPRGRPQTPAERGRGDEPCTLPRARENTGAEGAPRHHASFVFTQAKQTHTPVPASLFDQHCRIRIRIVTTVQPVVRAA